MSVNELSPLKYVSVRVANDDTNESKVLFALCDTGAEICCLDAGLATDLAPNIVGQKQLQPFCGVAPWTLVFGFLPRGPLAILKDSWCGEEDLPVNFGKNATT